MGFIHSIPKQSRCLKMMMDGDVAVVSEGNVDNDSDITVENDTDKVQQSS